MATIRASWRRTVSVAPYETETLELMVEDGGAEHAGQDIRDAITECAQLSRDLSEMGDQLVAERLAKRTPPPSQAPVSPDVFEPGRVVDVKPGESPW